MNEVELSIVVPLFNEETNVEWVAAELVKAFESANIDYELVLVNNGSKDRTGEILGRLTSENSRIRVVSLVKNAGYGGGILSGLHACSGRFIGYTWGDGQVAAASHVEVYQKLKREGLDLCKARRIERHDGPVRKVVTVSYNLLFPLFFRSATRDVNGCPKMFKREVFEKMNVVSKDWFIDAEIMIKSSQCGSKSGEVPVVFAARRHGSSNVGFRTVMEFIRNMIAYKLRGSFGRNQ